jgi:hypothetical protein
MGIVNVSSLGRTLDAVNEALFFGRSIPDKQREVVAAFIASRQGLPHSYSGLFAPTEQDFREGLTVFTGEKRNTRAGTSHILGEESLRALHLLGVATPEVCAAISRAEQSTERILVDCVKWDSPGYFCCGICSVAMWRNILAGDFDQAERHLEGGVAALKASRSSDGRWGKFPFFYTLLALDELDSPAARAEKVYASPVLERVVRRASAVDATSRRRQELARRILASC